MKKLLTTILLLVAITVSARASGTTPLTGGSFIPVKHIKYTQDHAQLYLNVVDPVWMFEDLMDMLDSSHAEYYGACVDDYGYYRCLVQNEQAPSSYCIEAEDGDLAIKDNSIGLWKIRRDRVRYIVYTHMFDSTAYNILLAALNGRYVFYRDQYIYSALALYTSACSGVPLLSQFYPDGYTFRYKNGVWIPEDY